MSDTPSRSEAAKAVEQALDPTFFDACSHPVRVAIIRRLVAIGASDISELSKPFPQDRSVVSRHLALLERAGIATSERRGRHVIYDLDGPAVIARLEPLLSAIQALSQICCPPENSNRQECGEAEDQGCTS